MNQEIPGNTLIDLTAPLATDLGPLPRPEIIRARPPNFGQIIAKFPEAAKATTIFTYGSKIYYCGDEPLTPALLAHEGIHVLQQRYYPQGVAGWWERYLEDVPFRFVQELNAHQVEYQECLDYVVRDKKTRVIGQHRFQEDYDRPLNRIERRGYLEVIAKRLSGPLYGRIVSFDDARRLILGKKVKVWEEAMKMRDDPSRPVPPHGSGP